VAFAFVNNAVVTLATMHRDGGSEYAKAAIREALLRMLQGVLKVAQPRSPLGAD